MSVAMEEIIIAHEGIERHDAFWDFESAWPSKFDAITLKRGITADMDFWTWREAVVAGEAAPRGTDALSAEDSIALKTGKAGVLDDDVIDTVLTSADAVALFEEIFGFEDLPNGGDNDFDDIVLQVRTGDDGIAAAADPRDGDEDPGALAQAMWDEWIVMHDM